MRTGVYGWLLLLVSALGANASLAQSYPAKPIRILTTGAGGGGDLTVRLVAPEISTVLGQPVVIENRPNTATLAPAVAKAPPDGYTLLVWGGAMWLAPLLEEVSYDPIKDFATIAALSRAPSLLVVHPSLPVKSVAELVSLLKARPGQLNYSAGPTGSSSQISGDLFKYLAKVDFVAISYKGGSQVTTDLLSGQVHWTVGQAASMGAEAKAGRLRVLASGGTQRSLLFPDLPTVAETLPGFVSESLFGFWAPAKTPDAIVRRLNQETVRALEKTDVRERLLKAGYEPVGGTPEQFSDSIKSEMARVGKMIKELGGKKPGG